MRTHTCIHRERERERDTVQLTDEELVGPATVASAELHLPPFDAEHHAVLSVIVVQIHSHQRSLHTLTYVTHTHTHTLILYSCRHSKADPNHQCMHIQSALTSVRLNSKTCQMSAERQSVGLSHSGCNTAPRYFLSTRSLNARCLQVNAHRRRNLIISSVGICRHSIPNFVKIGSAMFA